MWWPFKRKKEVPRSSTILTIPGDRVRVTLCEARYFTEKEMAKIQEALYVLSYVLNSDEFKESMGVRSFAGTIINGGGVYDILMTGNESITGVTGTFGYDYSDEDHELDFVLQAYNSWWSRVIGYGLPGGIATYINRKFLLSMKPWEVAGNLCHEKLHQLGFDHTSAADHGSVPYAVGYLVEDLGKEHFEEALKLRPMMETIIYTGRIS